MSSILAKSLLAAFLAVAVSGTAHAAEQKKEKPAAQKTLYVSPEEAGNKMFFSMTGWHGARNYWMAGAYQHSHASKSGKKAEPKK
jgi:hypothetical protein